MRADGGANANRRKPNEKQGIRRGGRISASGAANERRVDGRARALANQRLANVSIKTRQNSNSALATPILNGRRRAFRLQMAREVGAYFFICGHFTSAAALPIQIFPDAISLLYFVKWCLTSRKFLFPKSQLFCDF